MTDGEHIVYYNTGEIFYKCNYLDGKIHGEFIKYYHNGEIQSHRNFTYNKLYGKSIHYNESGVIWTEYYYINGKSVTKLKWISYNRNKKLELLGL